MNSCQQQEQKRKEFRPSGQKVERIQSRSKKPKSSTPTMTSTRSKPKTSSTPSVTTVIIRQQDNTCSEDREFYNQPNDDLAVVTNRGLFNQLKKLNFLNNFEKSDELKVIEDPFKIIKPVSYIYLPVNANTCTFCDTNENFH